MTASATTTTNVTPNGRRFLIVLSPPRLQIPGRLHQPRFATLRGCAIVVNDSNRPGHVEGTRSRLATARARTGASLPATARSGRAQRAGDDRRRARAVPVRTFLE